MLVVEVRTASDIACMSRCRRLAKSAASRPTSDLKRERVGAEVADGDDLVDELDERVVHAVEVGLRGVPVATDALGLDSDQRHGRGPFVVRGLDVRARARRYGDDQLIAGPGTTPRCQPRYWPATGSGSRSSSGSVDATSWGPSTSMFGRIRSSHFGIHQLRSPEQFHRRRHEQHADHRGVDRDRDGEAEAEHLEAAVVTDHERQEHAHHDQRRGGDHPSGDGHAVGHGDGVVRASCRSAP